MKVKGTNILISARYWPQREVMRNPKQKVTAEGRRWRKVWFADKSSDCYHMNLVRMTVFDEQEKQFWPTATWACVVCGEALTVDPDS